VWIEFPCPAIDNTPVDGAGTTAGREIAHLSPGAVSLPETSLLPQDRVADRPPSVGLWIILGEVLEQVVPARRGMGDMKPGPALWGRARSGL
jgi:hypothetical protein